LYPDASTQFVIDVPWINKFGIYFSAGIDGISMIMVLLTTVLVPLIILTTYQHQYKNEGAFYGLILFMQAGYAGCIYSFRRIFILRWMGSSTDPYLLYMRPLGWRKPYPHYY
jgi:NADH:ubiquinone oxidoreductase subunit 4 (subunit M)